jgi:hypothetical protein
VRDVQNITEMCLLLGFYEKFIFSVGTNKKYFISKLHMMQENRYVLAKTIKLELESKRVSIKIALDTPVHVIITVQ